MDTDEGADNPGALPEAELRRALHAELFELVATVEHWNDFAALGG